MAGRRHTLLGLCGFAFLLRAAGAQTPAIESLEPGKPIERQIKGDESHAYRLALARDQYALVAADQRGIDFILKLKGPDGKTLIESDWLPGTGEEVIGWIAAEPGDYQILIQAAKQPTPGTYRLDLRALRSPTPQDRSRVAALLASRDAAGLRATNTADSIRQAAAKYEAAIRLWQAVGDQRWEGIATEELGEAYYMLGQLPRARDAMLRALPLHRAAGDQSLEAMTLSSLGVILDRLGDSRQALKYLEQSLAMRETDATTINNIALCYEHLGERDKALEFYYRSLALRREQGQPRGEAVALSNLATTYGNMGQLEKSIELSIQALEVSRAAKYPRGEANALDGIGRGYFMLGENRKAGEYLKQALVIWEKLGETQALSAVLTTLGSAASAAKNYDQATAYYDRALSLRRAGANKRGEASVLIAICSTMNTRRQPDKAREAAEQAYAITSGIGGSPREVGSSLRCMGEAHAQLGEWEKARARLREADAVHRAAGESGYLSLTLAALAAVERDAGNLAEALARIQEAVKLAELARADLSPDLRVSFRASRAEQYALEVDVLMRMHAASPAGGFDARALEACERWRARSLIEMAGESRSDLRQALSLEQRDREDQILARTASLQKELFRASIAAARKRELDQQLAGAERDLELYQIELRATGSRYASVQYAETLGPDRIRRELLGPDTALIEYALGEQRSYVWAATAAGLTSAILPGRQEIENRVANYRKELSQRVSALTAVASLTNLDGQSRELYRMLIGPLDKALSTTRRLIVVPDGALAYLTFETLLGRSRVIERFAVSYAPSASALAMLKARTGPQVKRAKTLLAFADPLYQKSDAKPVAALEAYAERGFDFTQLPYTRSEVTAIGSLFRPQDSRIYLGADAREQLVKTEPLRDYRFIHFATHGYFDEERPARSGIVLSLGGEGGEDGVLQVPEILRLDLDADLVTLSACQTGLGRILAGEGVMGLTRAFLYAGARSVVVSLWNVNDSATAELMKTFYRNLSRGLSREEALRQAKLFLMRNSQAAWRHPYYWAPFVFVGDAGPSAP